MSKIIETLPLCVTEDHNIFTTILGNRVKNQLHVNKLKRAFKDYGNITEISPLLVNEKFEIVDGQHRFWAIQELSKETGTPIEIFYLVRNGLDADDAKSMNSGAKPWTPDDYARSYSLDGNKEYATYLSFRRRYDLNGEVLMKYLAPNDGDRNEFRIGDFEVENVSKSQLWCGRLEEMQTFYRDHKHRSFALAFLTLVSHKQYDHGRMLSQLDKYSSELIRVPLKNRPMREALIDIYNRGIADKVRFE